MCNSTIAEEECKKRIDSVMKLHIDLFQAITALNGELILTDEFLKQYTCMTLELNTLCSTNDAIDMDKVKAEIQTLNKQFWQSVIGTIIDKISHKNA